MSWARFEDGWPVEVDILAIQVHLQDLRERRDRRGWLNRLGVDHGQAARSGKPETAVRRSGSAPACWITRGTLSAAETVVEAVIGRSQYVNPPGREVPKLLFRDAAD